MPGVILEISVSQGQTVSAGDTVLILEAMKMENEIPAPRGGVIQQILVSPGATVKAGETLFYLG